jgi:hypothetical protein
VIGAGCDDGGDVGGGDVGVALVGSDQPLALGSEQWIGESLISWLQMMLFLIALEIVVTRLKLLRK